MASKQFLEWKKNLEKKGYEDTYKQQEEKPQPSPIKFSPTATQDIIRNTVESKFKTKPYDFTLDTSQKTPEQKKNIAYNEMLEKNPALKLAEKYVAGVSGAANTATLGLFPTLLKAEESIGRGQKGTYQRMQDIQERNPITTGIGEFAGYLVPGALATKALQATSIGQKLLPKAGESVGKFIGKGALTGVIEGAPLGAIEGGFESIRDDKPFLPTVAESTAQGAIGGALFGGLFGATGKGIDSYNTFKTGMKNVREAIDNYQFPQLREPQLVPLPDRLAKNANINVGENIPMKYRQPLPKIEEPLMLPPPSQKFYLDRNFSKENAGKQFRPVKDVTETVTEKYLPVKLKSMSGKTFTLKPKDVEVSQPKVDVDEINATKTDDVSEKFLKDINTLEYNYYYKQRPPSIGSQPSNGILNVSDYGMKKNGAWGEVTYNRKLTDKELKEYDLEPDEFYNGVAEIREEKKVLYDKLKNGFDAVKFDGKYNTAILSKNVKGGDKYQVTIFDKKGIPWSDSTHNNLESVIDRLIEGGHTEVQKIIKQNSKLISDFTPQNKIKMKTREVQFTKKVPVKYEDMKASLAEVKAKQSPFYVEPQFRKEVVGDATRPVRKVNTTQTTPVEKVPTPKQQEAINTTPKNVIEDMTPIQNKNATQGNVASNKTVQTGTIDFSKIKSLDDLPKDEEGLIQFLEEANKLIESGEYKFLNIDLQLFAREAEKRLKSKVYTNTFEKSEMFEQAEKDILNSAFTDDAVYTRKTEQESIKKAKARLAKDYEGEKKRLLNKETYSGEDVDTLFGIMEQELIKARMTGDYTTVREIAKNGIRKSGTELGRGVQAFAKYSRTAEGKIAEAEKVVDSAEDAFKKENPKKAKNMEEDVKNSIKEAEDIKKQTEKIIDDVVDNLIGQKTKDIKRQTKDVKRQPKKNNNDVVDELTGQETSFPKMLSDRIVKALKPKTPAEQSFIKQMLNDLFGEAKEKIELPPPINNRPSAIEKVRDTIKFADYTGEIRKNAKEILEDMFKDSPEMLKVFNDYFTLGYKPTKTEQFQKQLTKIMKQKLGNDGINKWVKDWYATGREAKENFVEAIVKETGLEGQQARQLKNVLDTRLKNELKAKREALLDKLMTPKQKREAQRQKGTEKISILTNAGMIENTKFVDRISAKMSSVLKQMFDENNLKLSDIVRMSLKDRKNAKGILLRDVFQNVKVEDEKIVQLLEIINKEFDTMTQSKQQQILQSLLKDRTTTPKTHVEKVVEKINLGVYDNALNEEIRNAIKRKYNLPTLDDTEVKFIADTIDKLKKMNVESDAYRIMLGKVEKIIADKSPVTFRDKFRGIQRVSWLPNFKTLLTRNPAGNVILAIAENVKDIPASVIDATVSLVRKSERTTLGGITPLQKIGWQAEGFKKGFKDWLLDVKNNVDTSPTRGQLELVRGRVFDNSTLNAIDEFVRRSLQLGDRPFYEAAYNSQLKEIMKIKKAKVATIEMKQEAKLHALDRVFQNDSELAKRAAQLRNSLGIVGDIVMPFTQTPANILDKLLDYSGGGIIKGLYQIGKSMKGDTFNQKLFVDRLGRSFTGVGLITLGYVLASKDIVEGGAEKSKDANEFKKSVGKIPYSISFPNGIQYSFDWAQPIAGLLAMGVDAYKAGKDKKELIEKIYAGAVSGVNAAFKQSFLQGLFKLLSGYSPAVSIGTSLYGSTTGIANPTMIRQIKNVIDPVERETYSENFWRERANTIIKNIPFASKTLPPKLNTFGKPIKRDDGLAMNIFKNMFNPGNMASYTPTTIQKEILRVYTSTNKNVFPNIAEKSIKHNGETYKLTTEQYQNYQKWMGEYTEKVIAQVINSAQYRANNVNDGQRAEALQKVMQDSMKYAEEKIKKQLALPKEKAKQKNPIKFPRVKK